VSYCASYVCFFIKIVLGAESFMTNNFDKKIGEKE